MCKMYNRSFVMLEQSKTALGNVAIDDAYLDVACFEAQQAIEFILKAILLDYGIKYDKSHDVRYLLGLVVETGFTFDKMDALDILADTVTSWEEKSRYGKGIKTQVQTVQRVHNIYKSINEAYLQRQMNNQK